ncbi:non-ribosomal peptide synthetase/type I polyketide synthase [Azospirillum sp. Sh1]|uniref:non-ribosomal peptide synthetase/type I polyketide synthase n=1 Tax=Azospirillum sp. Sh1 TaxID=2607285 RepID=UPI0011EC4E6E|nr:non-ribosomal peptide synthetase/type I polyketide synthase [Azospirillum sp. Sh1]KAA0578715.1 amino acid adenylation domain-containing protein [Azospirillum sp. Sh1]
MPIPTDTPATEPAELSPVKYAALAGFLRRRADAASEAAILMSEPIAITGMAFRLPGGCSMAEFDDFLLAGRDAIGPVPPGRWAGGDLPASVPQKAGFLPDVRSFDPALFNLSGREAEAMDPQQLMLLETVWEAMETAGLNPRRLKGSRTGVYVGLASRDYADQKIAGGDAGVIDAWFGQGTQPGFAAGRISYVLGLNGPALVVDTACSSSLVALHVACQALRAGDCGRAVVAGVHLILSPGGFIFNAAAGALAPDGRSKSFDASADGFGRGEGCVALILRPLSDALADGDLVLAVIRGSAVNQDGASGGLTAPSGAAQEAMLRAALASARLRPGDIDLIEAHGTGTPLGDPIELRALSAVFGPDRAAGQPLLVGSVKPNIGHLEAASGLAGVVRAVLSLRSGRIAPHPCLVTPTPHVDWSGLGIAIPRDAMPWPDRGRPRRAGVSSFGMSGTNAHVVLEEAPPDPRQPPDADRSCHALVLSARSVEALRVLAGAQAEALAAGDAPLGSVCLTANAGRARHAATLAVVGTSSPDIAGRLAAVARGEQPAGVMLAPSRPREAPALAFMFTGQGAAIPGMARELYDTSPVFRGLLERCAGILDGDLDVPLLDLLFGEGDGRRLERTRYAQPALAAVEWSLATLLQGWGVTPAAVIGHSLGEYVAASVAGMIAVEDLLPLLAERGRMMDALPGGAMAAAPVTAEEAAAAIGPDAAWVSVAAINGPRSTVLAGEPAALERVTARLECAAGRVRRLAVSHAFHSPMMDPVLDALARRVDAAGWQPPRIPLAANLTGGLLPPGMVPSGADWARHAREPVRFADGIAAIAGLDIPLFVEIGPRPVLTALAAACLPPGAGPALPTLSAGGQEWSGLLDTLARLDLAGVPIDWEALDRPYHRRRVLSPPYPYQRRPLGQNGFPMTNQSSAAPSSAAPSRPDLLPPILELVSEALRTPVGELDPDALLLELGADSLSFVEIGRLVLERFAVTLAARDFFDTVTSIRALADHVARQAPPPATIPAVSAPAPVSVPAPAAPAVAVPIAPAPVPIPDGGGLAAVFAQQLALVESVVSRQIDALRGAAPAAAPLAPPLAEPVQAPVPAATPVRSAESSDHGPYRPPRLTAAPESNPARRRHLEVLTARFTERTGESKRRAEAARPRLADSRAAAGFRPSIKEMLYPITGARAAGSRLWDIDGNEYVDVSMDFGVNLFGHRPAFLEEAMVEAVRDGLVMATRSRHAGEVAELFCGLTGMDRVAFCQSGTESVMTAIRLARLATGRQTVALFRNSYHGHSDGVLAQAALAADGSPGARPIASGIPEDMVSRVMVLDYGEDSALDTIRRHAGRLAAVLVEPVQSRALHLQPREFLHRLRALTRELGILLIFDEMITGFRLHPGGAQAWFGVEADLATYGKALGGGVQMAAVAGRSTLVDGIDGGVWRYGDSSFPSVPTTFFAGTFNGAPLAMAASRAVLGEMVRRGPALQDGINRLAGDFAAELNGWLEAEEVPMTVVTCGSLFRFAYSGNLDLLFYHLLEKGVFVWEGRNCFLSAAHTPADMALVGEAVRDSVRQMREGGFVPPASRAAAERPAPVLVSAPQRPAEPVSLPLTLAQQQLWLLAQMGTAGVQAYAEPILLTLTGRLDLPALERAFDRLVARHEALRTAIDADGRHQVIGAPGPLPLPLAGPVSVGAPPEEQRAAWVAELLRTPFVLTRPPLLRAALWQEAEDRAVLAVVVHHIIADGWSMGVLVEDLFACYAAETGGGALPAAPAAQLSDLVGWQLRESANPPPRRRELESYWRKRLTPLPPRIELPFDRRPTAADRLEGGRRCRALPPDTRAALEALGRRQGATPFATLLAVVLSFLHRLAGQEDLAIGCPVLGRGGEARLMGAVGYATHLVVVRSSAGEAGGSVPFTEFLKATRQRLLEALDHQDLPYAELLRVLGVTWSPDRPPLVDVLFNLDRPLGGRSAGGLDVGWLAPPSRPAKFPLGINALDLGAGKPLEIELDYDAGLFSPAAADVLMGQLLAWADAVIAAPDAPLSTLTPAGAEEQALIARWSHTPRAWADDAPLPVLMARAAAAWPDEPAVSFGEDTLTYRELDRAAAALAARLCALGAGPDKVVACLFQRSLEMVVALVGIQRSGAAFLPLGPEDPPARRSAMLADAAPVALVMAAGTILSGDGPALPVIALGPAELRPADGVPLAPPATPGPADASYVIFTSGSTGRPKGVVNTQAGLSNRLRWMLETMPLAPGDAVVQKTPYTFDVSVWEFFWPLLMGARLVVAPPGDHRDPRAIARLIRRESITAAHFVPSMLSMFVAEPEAAGCTSLKLVLCSGEALTLDQQERFHALGLPAQLHNLYGPTEAAIEVTHWHCVPDPRLPEVPIGRPLSNVVVRVLEADGQPAAIGAKGEICLGGASVARGYLNRPDLTEAAFVPDPFAPGWRLYRTGDLGRWRPDGGVVYLGRRDSQVKLRGQRVEMGEIEVALRRAPGLADAAAGVVEMEGSGQSLVAWIVPHDADAFPRRVVPLPVPAGTGGETAMRLPNGLVVAAVNRGETEFLYREHFIDRVCLNQGVGLGPAPVVLDVGANIGLFALSVLGSRPDAAVYAVEPGAEAFAALSRNAERHPGIKALRLALGAERGTATLTVFPRLTLMSGIGAEASSVGDAVRGYLAATGSGGPAAGELREEMLAGHLESRQEIVDLATVSDVIAAHGLESVDLLKVDVEGGELDVLRGIAAADWPRIRQVAVEAQDGEAGGTLAAITALLESHGFRTAVTQDETLASSGLYMVHAVRPDDPVPPAPPVPVALAPADAVAGLHGHLSALLPRGLLPTRFVMMRGLPLTAHGKVDRRGLADQLLWTARETDAALAGSGGRDAVSGLGRPPEGEVEQRLARLWAESLGHAPAGVDEDFFQAGGHSLQAAELVLAVRKAFGAELPVGTFFARPNIAGLAAALDGAAATGAAPPAVPPIRRQSRDARRQDIRTLASAEKPEPVQ